MRYFIINKDEFMEVDDINYHTWAETFAEQYLLPEINVIINGIYYSLETIFNGTVDSDEELRPFIIIYRAGLHNICNGVELNIYNAHNDDATYFLPDFESYAEKYNELVMHLKFKNMAAEN